MIGTSVHPRNPESRRSRSCREPEVEHHDIGWCARGHSSAISPVVARIDLVAAGLEVGDQRAQELRLVVDREHASSSTFPIGCFRLCDRRGSTTARRAAVGRVLDDQLAFHRPDEAPRDREPEPDPGPAPVAEALERLEHLLAISAGFPGPWSMTRTSTRSCDPARGRPAPVDPRRPSRPRSRRGSRRPARAARRRRAPGSASRARPRRRRRRVRRARDRRGYDVLQVHRLATSVERAGLQAAHVEEVATSAVSRSVSSSMVSRNAALVGATTRCRAGAGSRPTP